MADTPRRRATRSTSRANTPQAAPVLPALNTAPVHSYGSRGKVTLKHQVATAETSLEDIFAANNNIRRRASAIPEEDEDEDEESVADTQSLVPAEYDSLLIGDRNATAIHSAILYDQSNPGSKPGTRDGRSSMPSPDPPVRPVRSGPRSSASALARAIPGLARPSPSPPPRSVSRAHTPHLIYDDDAEPGWLSVFLLAVPRYLWRNFWALILGALLLSTFTLMPLPSLLGSHRDRIVRASKSAWGVPGYDVPPEKLEQFWSLLQYNQSLVDAGLPPVGSDGHQWHVNQATQKQMSEAAQDNLAMRWDMEEIKQYVPDRMAVDVVNGETVIKDEFWQALLAKFQDSSEAFEAFMERNQHAVENHISRTASSYLNSQTAHQKIISRNEVLHLLEQEHQARMTEVATAMSSFRHDTMTDARAIASQVATSLLESSMPTARDQIGAVARSRLLQNTLEALHMVNYLSPSLGARIDHRLTSPTKRHPKDPSPNVFNDVLSRTGLRRTLTVVRNSPIEALTKWSEMGDCWCASPSPPTSNIKGAAQLAIDLPGTIVPSRVILDHIPALGTLGIAAAPRKWEIWASFPSSVHAASAREYIAHELEQNGMAGTKGASCTTVVPPVERAVCVGQGGYDIHGENWVQSSELFVDLGKIDLGVRKVIFRVTDNWGADYTCLYRVRLAGKQLDAGSE